MPVSNKRWIFATALIVFATSLGLSGCGAIGTPPVPVSGAVFYNGTALPFARVVFHPQEITGRTVATVTDIRGRFEVMEGEVLGLPPGQYSVTISYYLTATGDPGRPEATVDFGPDGWRQLLPDKYSEKSATGLSQLVVPEGSKQPNTKTFELTGDDLVLPSGAQQPRGQKRVVADADGDGEKTPPPVRRSTSGGGMMENLIVYGGGAVLVLAVVAGAFVLLRRRVPQDEEEGESTYQYEGEMDESQETAEGTPAPPAPRKRKKRRKKRVRKRTESESSAEEIPPATQSAEEPMQGSPFPVLDEGMDEDDAVAAFISGEEPDGAGSPDATAAQWTLAAGGFVKIQESGEQPRNIKKSTDLPTGQFQLQGIFFEKVQGLTDERLAELEELPDLDTLDLASTAVTDEGLAVLKRLSGLRTLALSRTKITDAGLAHVAALAELRALLLYRTKITDAGIEHLKKLSNLKTVELKRTEVSKEAAQELRESLPKCKVII